MRSMVEGRSCHTLRNNHSNHPIQLIENIARSDPQHGISVGFKVDLTQPIDRGDLVMLVNPSIDFDQQPRLDASKVRDIASDGMLAAKLEAVWPGTECLPEQHFRQCHRPP